MSVNLRPYWCWGSFCLLVWITLSQVSANETQSHLPLGSVLDSHGNPIAMPEKADVALQYTPTVSSQSQQVQSRPSTKHSKADRRLNKRRPNVADNPSCRWLDKRMQGLEKQLNSQRRQQFSHHAEELAVRQQEWQCLQCGGMGPKPSDHSRCQYRR
ncbi:hypothetical protein [Shewanella waksmanii]|uniref:hypothetical protein n=1 Tax=Shewanella waksmanii TaxID=213783 RepID=UPI00048E2B83|nr:hypothetical protein [Shewanella waksmanii]